MGVTNFDIIKANAYLGLPSGGEEEVESTGKTFWVCNGSVLPEGGIAGSNSNSGLSPLEPFQTIDYAVGRCLANRGDKIKAMPGHSEAVTAAAGLDLDTAGITIEFLGEGTLKANVTFSTAVTADMDVDAANITLINPRFVAAIDALTGPIDVNAARFTIINGEYCDAAGIDTTDCIVADANADNLVIEGWTYLKGDEAGTQKQSNIQIAGADRPILRRIDIVGSFATGPIENGTAWVDAVLENVLIENTEASPTVGILLQATSSGSMRFVHIRVASGTTYLTANNDMQFFDCWGTGADANAAEEIGTMPAGTVEAKIDAIQAELSGTAGIAAFPSGAAAANAVSMAEVLRYVQENVIVGTGTALPGNSSLYGVLAGATGIPTFPNAAVPANDVSIAEVLRSVWAGQCGTAAGENGVATWPSSAAPGNGVSIAEVLGIIYDAQQGSAGLATYPASAAAANGVSMVEVLRYVQDLNSTDRGTAQAGGAGTITLAATASATSGTFIGQQIEILSGTGVGQTALITAYDGGTKVATTQPAWALQPDNTSVYSIRPSGFARVEAMDASVLNAAAIAADTVLGADNNNNVFASTNVVANHDGSLIERLEALASSAGINPTAKSPNYFAVTADMTNATWNTATTHEIATVTGMVQICVIPQVTGTLTDAADLATIQLGIEGTTNAVIAATGAAGNAGNTLSTNEFWIDATPADVIITLAGLTDLTFVVGGGLDVGYEIAGEALTGGSIIFHVFWTPLDATGAVVAGAGGVL